MAKGVKDQAEVLGRKVGTVHEEAKVHGEAKVPGKARTHKGLEFIDYEFTVTEDQRQKTSGRRPVAESQ